MKESKFIDDKKIQTITNYVDLESSSKRIDHPFAISVGEEQFKIVEEFSDKASAIDKKQLKDDEIKHAEEEATLLYAEEVFDDDNDSDDIYGVQLRERLLEKQKHRSYLEIGKEIDAALLKNGFMSEVGFNFLAATSFSRFLYFKQNELLDEFLVSLAKTTQGLIKTYVANDENTYISDDESFIELLSQAKRNTNKPVYVYLKSFEPKRLFEYLRVVMGYIENPDGDSFILSKGSSIYIPHNLYFVYTLDDHEKYYEIPRRLLRFSAMVQCDISRSPIENGGNNSTLFSLEELKASFKEASDIVELNEDSWRKIDTFVNAIGSVNGYILQNKILRRLENYLVVLTSRGIEVDEAVDLAFANNIISEAIITTDKEKFIKDTNLVVELEDIFGSDSMSRTKEIIQSYLGVGKIEKKLEAEPKTSKKGKK